MFEIENEISIHSAHQEIYIYCRTIQNFEYELLLYGSFS